MHGQATWESSSVRLMKFGPKFLLTFLLILFFFSFLFFYLLFWVSQTSFSLYLYNQWTDFHKLSCFGKLQMRAICIYVGCTKVITNNWDIKLLVTVKVLSANISWTAGWIHMIELASKSVYQTVSNDIWYIT